MSTLTPAKQANSATKPHKKMEGHTDTIYRVLHLHGGRQIITCSEDGSIRVWDLESGKQVGEPWKDEGSGGVHAIALSPDGTKVASGSFDGAVRLWEIDTGNIIKTWGGHTKEAESVCWSPDGGRVVSGFKDGTFIVWNAESGEIMLGPIEAGTDDPVWAIEGVWAVCYSPDGKMIATGIGKLKVWDANTGELLKILSLKTVSLKTHSPRTGNTLHQLFDSMEEDERVLCLAWRSDGKTLIAGSFDKIRKFDTVTWTEAAILEGHEDWVEAISLSPNECILASASSDETVRLWNLERNKPIGSPLHHKKSVTSAAFSADGKLLTTVCDDHHIYT